jgi:hypothetical protein
MATLSTKARNAACDAVVDLMDEGAGAGLLVFRTAGDTEVATLTFSDPAFGGAATGVATASAITSDTSATGNASAVTKATFEDSDAEVMLTATVGTSGNDINLSSTTIGAGDTVAVSALTVTCPAS